MIKKLLFTSILCFLSLFSRTGALSPPDPLINTIQGQGLIGLNFGQPGTGEQIAYFIVNSNSATGFEVKISLTNRGKFIAGTSEIPMTSLVLDKVSGTLGAGLTEPVNLDVLAVVSGGGEFSWNPGNSPTTETVNYIVELKADWADPHGKLAGLYLENITFTISVNL